MWLEARYFPNTNEDILWDGDHPVMMGFFQIELHFKNDITESLAGLESAGIITHFPRGMVINGGIKIKARPTRGPRVVGEASSFIPITVYYEGIWAETNVRVTSDGDTRVTPEGDRLVTA